MRRRFSRILAVLLVSCVVIPAAAQEPASPTEELGRILDRGKWRREDLARARQLLHAGASLRTSGPRGGRTVLMFAASTRNLPLMRAALRAGEDPNGRTHNGAGGSPLWCAVRARSQDAMRLLLQSGAQVDGRDSYGRTPLMMAAEFRFRPGMALLLAHGADINARNHKGYTALVYTGGHPGLTRFLRERGAVE